MKLYNPKCPLFYKRPRKQILTNEKIHFWRVHSSLIPTQTLVSLCCLSSRLSPVGARPQLCPTLITSPARALCPVPWLKLTTLCLTSQWLTDSAHVSFAPSAPLSSPNYQRVPLDSCPLQLTCSAKRRWSPLIWSSSRRIIVTKIKSGSSRDKSILVIMKGTRFFNLKLDYWLQKKISKNLPLSLKAEAKSKSCLLQWQN